MQTTLAKPLAFSQVLTTTQYELFKSIAGNRTINALHCKRLKQSMEEQYLFTVIIVNEKKEIIDGQHRFECIRDLGLPLYYIVCKGYGLEEVHRLNANSKDWKWNDYLSGYCDLGYGEYLKYRTFQQQYGFDHKVNLTLLVGIASQATVQDFHDGTFKVKNYRESCKIAEKILMLQPYYPEGYKKMSFVLAMVSLFKNEVFEFTEFIAKLKLQPTALQNCSDITTYKSLIEEIYNYRRKNKVNLRYSPSGE